MRLGLCGARLLYEGGASLALRPAQQKSSASIYISVPSITTDARDILMGCAALISSQTSDTFRAGGDDAASIIPGRCDVLSLPRAAMYCTGAASVDSVL